MMLLATQLRAQYPLAAPGITNDIALAVPPFNPDIS